MKGKSIKIGNNLRYAMTKRSMSQKDLATAMHRAPCTISLWVSGNRLPRLSEAFALAKVLGMRVDDLFYLTKG